MERCPVRCCCFCPHRYLYAERVEGQCIPWVSLYSTMSQVLTEPQSFVLTDANARTRVGKRMEYRETRGTYVDDYRASDGNGTALLRLANDNGLALVNTFIFLPWLVQVETGQSSRHGDAGWRRRMSAQGTSTWWKYITIKRLLC